MDDAAKFTSLKDWRTFSNATYKAAHRNGWLNQCAAELAIEKRIWSKSDCLESARRFDTRKQWRSTEDGEKAYQAAHRNGWLEECTGHMSAAIKGTKKIDWNSVPFLYEPIKNDTPRAKHTAGSHFLAWWRCPIDNSHEFQKAVRDVVRGWHCPFCEEEEFDGKNSIKDKAPDWYEQWDFDKNGANDPTTITRKSTIGYWWTCENNHSWKESPKDRLNNNIGCRECNALQASELANATRIKKRNSLLDRRSEVVQYWSEANQRGPDEYSPGSNSRIWLLRPSDGMPVESTPKKISKSIEALHQEVGLLEKVTRTPIRSESFAARHSDLLEDWSPLNDVDPYTLSEYSGYEAQWVCSTCGHKWVTTIASRSSGRGCKRCASLRGAAQRNTRRIAESGSAADHHPSLRKEWHPTRNGSKNLAEYTSKSAEKVWWQCSYGHEWEATISNRTGGSACPICAGRGSKIELRVLSELEYFFGESVWQYKDERGELDIYLPAINAGIEIDGYPWHEGKAGKDEEKNNRYAEAGIRVFRLRDQRLGECVSNSVTYDNSAGDSGLFCALVSLLKILEPQALAFDQYSSNGVFINEARYNELIAHYPRPPKGRALADVVPNVTSTWNYQKNTPVTPEMVFAGSNQQYWFTCPIHGDYASSPKSLSHGHGCTECGRLRGAAKRKLRGTGT